MNINLAAYRRAFFDEAADHLTALNAALLRLGDGADHDAVTAAFRAAHSVKAGADAVGLSDVSRAAHEIEEALEKYRGEDRVPR